MNVQRKSCPTKLLSLTPNLLFISCRLNILDIQDSILEGSAPCLIMRVTTFLMDAVACILEEVALQMRKHSAAMLE